MNLQNASKQKAKFFKKASCHPHLKQAVSAAADIHIKTSVEFAEDFHYEPSQTQFCFNFTDNCTLDDSQTEKDSSIDTNPQTSQQNVNLVKDETVCTDSDSFAFMPSQTEFKFNFMLEGTS